MLVYIDIGHIGYVDILLKTIKIHDSGDEDGIDISPEMTTIGKIDVFDETLESWETYVERVQHFFAANDVDEDHKVPTLLSLIHRNKRYRMRTPIYFQVNK